MLHDEIAQLQADLADFKLASQELEKELEADLEDSQRQIDDLSNQLADALKSVEHWKVKYAGLQADSFANEESLKLKLQQVTAENSRYMHKIRAVEIENDDIERSERIAKSTVQELEERNAELLEKLAVSDSALALAKEELQRAKDELRENSDEIQTLKDGMTKRTPSNVDIKKRTLRRMEGIRHQVENIEGHIESVRRFSAQPSKKDALPRVKRPPVERGRDKVPDLRAIASVSRGISPPAGHGKPLNGK
ncbi:Nuclear distribution protein nudE 1 [Wickerhamiella sorbophila]|uniref:Nuclear distribution protein nudE 1 n=1 Tax=Wickerhamiella sorbophila TaxID=45607 RepID=A0A2T0FG07_9ASCO|nr:Nuclear distribution protein nudE 1 [Wickerhamiella sorbophila]PRT53910.1 Nuclear distribution protein nudE 1 [Wickerhamiella sorbophila]